MKKNSFIDYKILYFNNDFSKEINKILEDEKTVSILYDTYPDPYDYVDNIFPLRKVKNVKSYLYDPSVVHGSDMSQMNFSGFYSMMRNSIFIADRKNRNKIPSRFARFIVIPLFHVI